MMMITILIILMIKLTIMMVIIIIIIINNKILRDDMRKHIWKSADWIDCECTKVRTRMTPLARFTHEVQLSWKAANEKRVIYLLPWPKSNPLDVLKFTLLSDWSWEQVDCASPMVVCPQLGTGVGGGDRPPP